MVAREGATDKVWCAWYAWSWRRCTAARAAGGGCEEGVGCTSSAVGGMGPMSSCGRRGVRGYRAGCQGGAAVGAQVLPRCCPGAAEVGTAGGYSRRVSRRVSKHHAQVIDRRVRMAERIGCPTCGSCCWGRCSPAPRPGPSAA
eukprot:scaffold25386_cov18-Phaeocystis_antarctica.AAC.1